MGVSWGLMIIFSRLVASTTVACVKRCSCIPLKPTNGWKWWGATFRALWKEAAAPCSNQARSFLWAGKIRMRNTPVECILEVRQNKPDFYQNKVNKLFSFFFSRTSSLISNKQRAWPVIVHVHLVRTPRGAPLILDAAQFLLIQVNQQISSIYG